MVCQWSRVSFSPVGSTRMSATFWVSRTSESPLRISSSGLKRTESMDVGSNRHVRLNCRRHPAVSAQFSFLMS